MAVYLDDYCLTGMTLTLPCRSEGTNRAGTMRFRSYPATTCNVTITIDTSSYECLYNTNYGVYFNVK